MSESIQFRVRFDPSPVIHDRRALFTYRETPDASELRDRMMREMASRLGIPRSLLVGNSNYSSAAFGLNRGRAMTHEGIAAFMEHARRRLLRDITRMAMLRYQIDFYLRHHERLPGSTRTARLRKKRITVVQAFCYRYFKRHHWRYS